MFSIIGRLDLRTIEIFCGQSFLRICVRAKVGSTDSGSLTFFNSPRLIKWFLRNVRNNIYWFISQTPFERKAIKNEVNDILDLQTKKN